MKLLTLLFALLLSFSSLASERSDVTKKLAEIESDIRQVQTYITQGEAPEIYQKYLKELELEKAKYQKLAKKLKPKKEDKSEASGDPTSRKIFPTVIQNDLANRKVYQDESVPVEKRYDLIIKELGTSYDVVDKLKSLPQAQQSSNIMKFIAEEETKIRELEKLRLAYELKVREIEQSEFSEMKKTGVRVGGMIDVYYQWDFNKPDRSTLVNGDTSDEIPYKNYTNKHNDFTINLLEINVMKSYRNLDFYADIDFGEQPNQNRSISEDPISNHFGQAFLRYKIKEADDLVLTAGKFYSHFGMETPKNIENKNYSRPFYYTLVCPFWHEGLAITKSGMGQFGAGLYIYDRTDRRTDNNTGKTYGFQLNHTYDKLTSIYNVISGAEGDSAGVTKEGNLKTQHEVILNYTLNDSTMFAVDTVIGSNKAGDNATGKDVKWSSVVGYVDVKTSLNNTICARVENFRDLTSNASATNLFSTTSNPNVKSPDIMSYTLTNRYNLGNGSEIRAEFKTDSANKKLFPGEEGSFKKYQNTLIVGWLYSI